MFLGIWIFPIGLVAENKRVRWSVDNKPLRDMFFAWNIGAPQLITGRLGGRRIADTMSAPSGVGYPAVASASSVAESALSAALSSTKRAFRSSFVMPTQLNAFRT